MVKLVNFDAGTLSSSLEGNQPRPRVGIRCSFGSLAPSFFTFQIHFFHKTYCFAQLLTIQTVNVFLKDTSI